METLFHDKIASMTWSYSRINSYDQCPKMFYMTYIDEAESVDSAFAQWGSLCHSLFDDYAKGKLLEFELGDEYDARYPEYMTERFPPNKWTDLNAKYYDNGKQFFDDFEGFPENWEIISSEQSILIEIEGIKVRGYIDLLVRDKNDGKLIVVDHKSKSKFNSDEELEHYSYQLYFYALWVKEHYHEWPKELIFNMFRIRDEKRITFTESGLQKAIAWLKENVNRIYEDEDFPDKVTLKYQKAGEPVPDNYRPDFFCQHLCSVRYHCERSGLYIGEMEK